MPDASVKNAINKNQGKMFPLELNSPTSVVPEKSKAAEAHDKDIKIAIKDMFTCQIPINYSPDPYQLL